MSTQHAEQKEKERAIASVIARRIGEDWRLQDYERPDFLVEAEGATFGLEVTECFKGRSSARKGSSDKATERANHSWLQGIREEIAVSHPGSVRVRYNGIKTEDARQEIIRSVTAYLASQSPGDAPQQYRFADGWVTLSKSSWHSWTFLRDRVGWGSLDPSPIQAAIYAKAKLIEEYRRAALDIRLIVLADRTSNSGKIHIPAEQLLDLSGFNAVYFFSYPDHVAAFFRSGIRRDYSHSPLA